MSQPRPDAPGAAPDSALVRTFLEARSEAAFGSLYDRHTPALYAMALRLAGAPDDAEDLVQETWLRAVQKLSGFQWRSALRSWLIAVLINCWKESLRRRGRGLQLVDQGEPDVPPPVTEAVDLERALARLPAEYRAVVLLHDVNGHTHREIAEMLGMAEGTSKSVLFRARRLLRRAMGPDGPDIEKGTA